MLGPLVNAAAIVVCALAGRFLVKGIPARFEDHLKKAIGVVIVFVGIRGALDNESALLLVASVILGAVAAGALGGGQTREGRGRRAGGTRELLEGLRLRKRAVLLRLHGDSRLHAERASGNPRHTLH